MRQKMRRRTRVAAVALLAAAAGVGLAAPPAVAAAPVREGSPDAAVDRVADFYGAYIDAVDDGTDDLGSELRSHYLTEDLQQRLAAWEETNHADGVLRAQDVPTHWAVQYHDSGAGHLFTTVTLTWGTGSNAGHTTLAVQSDLSTKLISDIEESPS